MELIYDYEDPDFYEGFRRFLGIELNDSHPFSDLLNQALTRKGYAVENGLFYNSEVLEFYGDSMLQAIVSKKMAAVFKYENEDVDTVEDSDMFMYNSQLNEEELTKIRSNVVCKKNLAKIFRSFEFIDSLFNVEYSFIDYVNASDSEYDKDGKLTDSACEDTLEAIIGAIAVAVDFDFAKIEVAVNKIINIDEYLLQFTHNIDYYKEVLEYRKQYKLGELDILYNICDDVIYGSVKDDPFLEGDIIYGYNKKEVKARVYRAYYEKLRDNNILAVIPRNMYLEFESSINVLQEMWQKSFISEPRYEFESYLDNGDEMWKCTASIIFNKMEIIKTASASKKKDAKKLAADAVLSEIVIRNEGRKWKN